VRAILSVVVDNDLSAVDTDIQNLPHKIPANTYFSNIMGDTVDVLQDSSASQDDRKQAHLEVWSPQRLP
jgi:hypothetical protein